MTPNLVWKMVRRLIGQIVVSIVLGVVSFVLLGIVLTRISQDFRPLRVFGRDVLRGFGEVPIYSVGCFLFFLVFMVLLNWRRYLYVQQMNDAIAHIAQGHFDAVVPVRQNNEAGRMAENVNLLVERLKRSLDEERRTERSKNELVTNVSHDLRTPLTSILGYLGLIEQDRYRDEVELRHYVHIAYAKATRLNLLINDLFEYTRMSGGSVPLRSVGVNLVEMLSQLLEHYRLPLEQAGMTGTLDTRLPVGGELRVWADPDKLVRVFENLLANAMTYGKDGRRVDLLAAAEGRWARVEVTNYGEPIPESDLPRLFERFYRVDKARSGDDGGSGLGLAIAQGLVEKHGGSIQAFSDKSRTTFVIRIPLWDDQARQP